MAKRNPQSQADDSQPNATGGKPRARGSARSSSAGAPAAANPPSLSDTEAARPTPFDTAPPADTIASDPDVSRLEPREEPDADQLKDSPSEEEIRARAYDLYVKRGGTHGAHEEDWFTAEKELRKRKK